MVAAVICSKDSYFFGRMYDLRSIATAWDREGGRVECEGVATVLLGCPVGDYGRG